VNKYLTGTVSGACFALIFFTILAIPPWGHLSRAGAGYAEWATFGGLLAFAVTTVIHGRRIRSGAPGGTASVLASIAFGWLLTVIIGFLLIFVLLNVLWFLILPFSHHVTG
jgi:hypothetical protein